MIRLGLFSQWQSRIRDSDPLKLELSHYESHIQSESLDLPHTPNRTILHMDFYTDSLMHRFSHTRTFLYSDFLVLRLSHTSQVFHIQTLPCSDSLILRLSHTLRAFSCWDSFTLRLTLTDILPYLDSVLRLFHIQILSSSNSLINS